MKMICRKCKRIMTLNELAGYACGHFTTLVISAGLATWLAASLKDYFSNTKRGLIDETMAGACNGLNMACPKCKKTSCWDPLPEAVQPKNMEKQPAPLLTLITNKDRKRQISEFVDDDHSVTRDFYDITEDDLSHTELLKKMQALIEIDKDFYDPYLVVADIFFSQEKIEEGLAITKRAYEQAVARICDSQGRWPKSMPWGYLENRHLMRALESHADNCWQRDGENEALDIYRRLLQTNPNDNQGARYNILAIKLGLGFEEWQKPFEVTQDGEIVGLDSSKVDKWFRKNSKKFPELFDSFFKYHEGEK